MKPHPDEPAAEPTDEELILHHYGESADAAAMTARLAASPEASRRFAELQALLAAADGWRPPELPAGFEDEVWRRLQPRLGRAPLVPSPVLAAAHRFTARGRRWLPAAAAALLLLAVGYLAGRVATQPDAAAPRPLTAEARQRLLVETLAEHLERSQRLFTELANAEPGHGADLADEQRAARELLSANRLYRTAAEHGGREGVAALLDDMEPVLLELAHLPAEPQPADVEFLRRRIESQGLLFKTRVASELLSRSLLPAAAPTSRSTV